MTIDRELKRGSAEMMILSLVEDRARHGYEILKLLEERSEGVLKFHIGSVYPILYRLEKRGWIRGETDEGARRRRTYRITLEGRRVLKGQRGTWQELVAAIDRVARTRNA
ncbi:MAG TPA: helix-turn-helix transcriptional regulator [Vicinamibacteria bacterium]|nr:helix-turn-helix transcriptional regulator [Vicinamibacteria bacterium]